MRTKAIFLLLVVLALLAFAAPALAAPPTPAQDGLHTAHCLTKGTPAKVPFECSMPMTMDEMMECDMAGMAM